MNNFRRRSQAKKERTVVQTYRQIDNFTPMSINITNGTFQIDQTAGSTAELSVTVGYTATTYLHTRYDDGTVETSNPYTESGTVTLTEAKMSDHDFEGIWLEIGKDIELGDRCKMFVQLAQWEWRDSFGSPVPLPEESGGEITKNLYVNGYDSVVRISAYVANTGTQYYVNLSPYS